MILTRPIATEVGGRSAQYASSLVGGNRVALSKIKRDQPNNYRRRRNSGLMRMMNMRYNKGNKSRRKYKGEWKRRTQKRRN
jgi:hypothetical protein